MLARAWSERLVIDLSAIRHVDASGLAVLVGTQRRAVLLRGSVRLAAPQPDVARVLWQSPGSVGTLGFTPRSTLR